jgi:hypothetical protein
VEVALHEGVTQSLAVAGQSPVDKHSTQAPSAQMGVEPAQPAPCFQLPVASQVSGVIPVQRVSPGAQ